MVKQSVFIKWNGVFSLNGIGLMLFGYFEYQ